MTSFQITIPPSRRAAARFVTDVRRLLLKTLAEDDDITQSEIARQIGVHRSVISRELKGFKDIGLGRVAELGWAMGKTPRLTWEESVSTDGQNIRVDSSPKIGEGAAPVRPSDSDINKLNELVLAS